jgi:hypothetical protein
MFESRFPSLLNMIITGMLLLAIALGSGCKSTPTMKAFNIDLNVSETIDRSFTVDLVGLRSADDPSTQLDVDRYFAAGSQNRRDLFASSAVPVTRNIAADESGTISVMAANHARWGEWRQAGVMHLMVIVDRLGAASADDYRVGATDTRRLIIPLASDRWDRRDNRITIEAMSTRLGYSPHPESP